jgi:hypothetical protein
MAMLKLRLACESHAHFKIFRAIAVSGVAAILVMGLASVAATSALVAGPASASTSPCGTNGVATIKRR